MSDYNSQLPVRSKQDADERVQIKIVDEANPDTQQATVDTDKNVKVGVYGDRTDDQADIALALSEEGKSVVRGDYEADDSSEPSSVGLIVSSKQASPDQTHQLVRPTGLQGTTDNTIHAMHVALTDEAANPYSGSNPMPVTLEASEGTEVEEFDEAVDIAKDATDDHDYTVTALKTFSGSKIWASASGKMKIEVQLETAAASGIFNTKYVGFNSTANPNICISLEKIGLEQVAGAIVKIIRTNLDNQTQSLYSTIVGVEA